MRELRKYEVDDSSEPERAQRVWTQGRGTLFVVGCLIAAIAAFACLWVVNKRMDLQTSPPDLGHQDMEVYSLEQLWTGWVTINDEQLISRNRPRYLDARDQSDSLTILLYITEACVGVGVLMAMVAAMYGAKSPSEHRGTS